ncbi:MAG: hypothetical protein CBD76_00325 [Pelagibacteraceae bacterium TMED216]|nr:MAG: hypothetical protein CBD76_00325 [Pelagibacteraceae bacterium TMED216]|tara:strand:+ start:1899 stop:2648 length:750 start_codon:yes stop_codon:yes gene_type:complete
MKKFLKKILKKFRKSHLEYSGPYSTWSEAVKDSTGYESKIILKKVSDSTLQVLNGLKAYERDGTSFDNKPEKNTLLEELETTNIYGKVIVDMGGGLGSNYINYSNFFKDNNCIYYVVEQENFIEKGNEISNKYNLNLNFRKDLSEINENIDIIICSSFLQYIKNWKKIVSEIKEKRPQSIFVDRHPLTNKDSKILVQLNTGYYKKNVTYPLHIVNEEEFTKEFKPYVSLKRWDSDFDPPYFKGFHFRSD